MEITNTWTEDVVGKSVTIDYVGTIDLKESDKAISVEFIKEDIEKGITNGCYPWNNFNQCISWKIN